MNPKSAALVSQADWRGRSRKGGTGINDYSTPQVPVYVSARETIAAYNPTLVSLALVT